MATLELLQKLVEHVEYKRGWAFSFYADFDRGQGCRGPTLVISINVSNSYQPDHVLIVDHYMIVPDAAYNERSWRRWLFEQILLVERHEAMEFFRIDGHRPFAPNHGPGNDPYYVWELGTLADAQTTSKGVVRSDVEV